MSSGIRGRKRKIKPSKVHDSTYLRALEIIEYAKQGLTLKKMEGIYGVSRQRIYQYVLQAGLKDVYFSVYQKRIAKKRMAKLKTSIRNCKECGRVFIGKGRKAYCRYSCKRRFMTRYWKEWSKKRYNSEPAYKIKLLAYNQYYQSKRRFDNPN